ncbi:glycosyltransferase family 8 protein [Clostridium saudiense]|uniref:glycosyltransferase family 8 protein n=1 Tax=Clostridium saudiense TaxID=1414720 RepID=UPI0018A993E2|nr:glycosyltransferase family 8 protein [Clostridium saudiense]
MNLVVVYSSDDNYARHTGVSIVSLLDNNKHFDDIHIYVIDNKISKSNKENLKDIINSYKRKITFIDFNKYKCMLKLNMQWNISVSAYARLFIASILPSNIDKVLYFDCDTVLVDKVDELWNEDIKDYYIAGVADTVSSATKSAVGISTYENYINSGMLLINLKKWREDNIQDKFIDFIDSNNGSVTHHDQGVINGVLCKASKVLSPKFNLMTVYYTMKREDIISYYGIDNEFYSDEVIKDSLENPVYIHFTPGFTTRPWVKGCKHPKKQAYLDYLDKTPWKHSSLEKDKSKLRVKTINWIYRNLSFKSAQRICNTLMKAKLS